MLLWGLLCLPVVACHDAAGGGGGADDVDAGAPRLGRAGGERVSPEGAAVVVPRGALSAPAEIAVARYDGNLPSPPEGYSFAGDAFAFTPHGQAFEAPVEIRVPYSSTRLGKVVLRLAEPGAIHWQVIEDGPVYHKGIATLSVRSFSIYIVAHPGEADPIVCDPGRTACEGRCVDLLTDPAHCGLCRYDCDAGCVGGVCEVVLPPDCAQDADCDDGEFCNGTERCSGGTCLAGTAPSCDDGAYCNGVETCAGPACQAGTAVDCDDGDALTSDSCNDGTMQCEHVSIDQDAGT